MSVYNHTIFLKSGISSQSHQKYEKLYSEKEEKR